MKKLGLSAAVLLLVGLLVLSACAPGVAPTPAIPTPTPVAESPEWQKVVETAKKEGTLTIYSAVGSPLLIEAVIKEFPQKTGIVAQVLTNTGSEIREKVRMEQQTGAYSADAVWSAITTVADVGVLYGFGQTITVELPVEKEKDKFRIDPWEYDREGRRVLLFTQEREAGILVNTNMVKPGEINSWQDLLDPKWKDKIVMTDPRFPGGSTLQAYAASELGKDYWKKIAQQNPRYDRNPGRVIQAVAMGEKAIAIFAQTPLASEAILAGTPIKYIHLQEGSWATNFAITMVKNALHPNATMVFMNWLLTKEGHEIAMRAMKRPGIRKDMDPVWLQIPEFRPDAPKRMFSKVASRSEHAQEAVAFMREVLGEP